MFPGVEERFQDADDYILSRLAMGAVVETHGVVISGVRRVRGIFGRSEVLLLDSTVSTSCSRNSARSAFDVQCSTFMLGFQVDCCRRAGGVSSSKLCGCGDGSAAASRDAAQRCGGAAIARLELYHAYGAFHAFDIQSLYFPMCGLVPVLLRPLL